MSRMLVATLLVMLSNAAVVSAEPTYQGDPRAVAEVRAMTQKFLAVPSWRARFTFASGGAQTVEFVAPDRFHMTHQAGGVTRENYYIGGEVWLREGGACQKLPVSVGVNPREYVARSTGKITVAKGGREVVDGIPVQAYTLVSEQEGHRVQQRMLVATATGLPRRIEVQTDNGPFTIDYFDFGAQVVINNPPC